MGVLDFLKGLVPFRRKTNIIQGALTAPELEENFTTVEEPEKKSLTDVQCTLFIYQLFEDEHAKQNLERLGRNYQSEELLKIIRDLYDSRKWTDPGDNDGFTVCTEIIKNRILEKYIEGGDNQTKQLFGYLKDFDRTQIDDSLFDYYSELEWLYHIVTNNNEKIISIWSSGGEKSLDKYIEDRTDSEKYLSIKNSIIEQGEKGYDIRSFANNISDCLQVAKRSKDSITPRNIAQYNVLVMFIYGLGLLDRSSSILIDPITKEKVIRIDETKPS